MKLLCKCTQETQIDLYSGIQSTVRRVIAINRQKLYAQTPLGNKFVVVAPKAHPVVHIWKEIFLFAHRLCGRVITSISIKLREINSTNEM